MFSFRIKFLVVLLSLAVWTSANGQDVPATGTLEITGRPKNGTVEVLIERKRFYLFQGGLDANKSLIEKLRTSNVTSRDCFYCQMQASREYVAWLKAEDCESAYCREITAEDVTKVPEFNSAYQKSLVQYGNKPSIAKRWLTTNLDPKLRDGFYEQRRGLVEALLSGSKSIQSAMTDSVNFKALFIDIPLKESTTGKITEPFLISNLIPIEIGEKSYVWICEVAIGSKNVATLKLQIPEKDKPVKKCEVIVKDLPVCNGGTCAQK